MQAKNLPMDIKSGDDGMSELKTGNTPTQQLTVTDKLYLILCVFGEESFEARVKDLAGL